MTNTVNELATPRTTTTESRTESRDQNLEREAILDVFEALLADAERITKLAASNANVPSEAAAVTAHRGE